MPNKNEEVKIEENENLLSEAEKTKLIAEHLAYINDFNSHFPDNMKIQYDEKAFLSKLNDPDEVSRYKRSILREQKLQQQELIYAKLESQYGKAPDNRNYLNRNIQFAFKTDGSPESNAYNEKLYSNYVKNPEALLYTKLKNIMDTNPQAYYESLDDKGKLCDYYDFNQEVVEDAFVFATIVKGDALEWATPEMKNAIKSMKKPIESLGVAQREAYASLGSAYFTMPKLTPQQASILMASGPKYAGNDARPEIRNSVLNALWTDSSVEQPKEYYNKLMQQGMQLNKGFFLSHVALERQDDGTYKEVSFDDVMNNPDNPNLSIRKRTEDEIWHIRNISKEYETEYLGLWQKKYADVSGEAFDIPKIKDQNKGNIFERVFRRTSNEYKAFIKQFEEYNNPKSKDYLNRDKLFEKADAYEQHKISQGKSYEEMDTTSKGRMDFVHNVKETLTYMKKADDVIRNKIENKLYADPENRKSIGESFLNIEDVEEKNENNLDNYKELNQDIMNFLNLNVDKNNVEQDAPSNNQNLDGGEEIGELDEVNM